MDQAEFARRRKQLMRMMGDHTIAILPAAPIRTRSRDVEYRYRQDSDFYYLTGFVEPGAVVALIPGRAAGEYVLFCRERDVERELWDGARCGTEGAVANFGADDAFGIDDINDILPGLMEGSERVFYTMGQYPDFDAQLTEWVKELRSSKNAAVHAPHEFTALEHYLHDMRLYKSRRELSAMRKSAKVAVAAHKRAMCAVRPSMYEYELEAEYLHEFRRHAATPSYPAIVGGGANGCVLHYISNQDMLKDGDLVLVDAGCELDFYASDITRTYPVNGRFSAEQRAIYEIVLEAQYAAIDKTTAGNHWSDPHDAALSVIVKGLRALGLLKGSVRQILKDESYREFFMHKTGHWLGIDVHDVGDYKVDDEWRLLENGMVTTVEPGIYVAPGSSAKKCWQGIGVRIEDDVAVTRGAADVLSKGLVKEADDIEALMAAASARRAVA